MRATAEGRRRIADRLCCAGVVVELRTDWLKTPDSVGVAPPLRRLAARKRRCRHGPPEQRADRWDRPDDNGDGMLLDDAIAQFLSRPDAEAPVRRDDRPPTGRRLTASAPLAPRPPAPADLTDLTLAETAPGTCRTLFAGARAARRQPCRPPVACVGLVANAVRSSLQHHPRVAALWSSRAICRQPGATSCGATACPRRCGAGTAPTGTRPRSRRSAARRAIDLAPEPAARDGGDRPAHPRAACAWTRSVASWTPTSIATRAARGIVGRAGRSAGSTGATGPRWHARSVSRYPARPVGRSVGSGDQTTKTTAARVPPGAVRQVIKRLARAG